MLGKLIAAVIGAGIGAGITYAVMKPKAPAKPANGQTVAGSPPAEGDLTRGGG